MKRAMLWLCLGACAGSDDKNTTADAIDTDTDTDADADADSDVDADSDADADGDADADTDTDPTGSTGDTGADPLDWPNDDGRFGAPTDTFVLPLTDGVGGYYPDLQATFPKVDWSTLDRLYLPAGHYPFLSLGNLPDRDPSDPLVITNQGGQVRVGALDHYYLFVINGGSNWVLTGDYDPVSLTGDAAFPGHRDGAFAESAGTYGILIDDQFVRDGNSGLGIGGGATDFEVDFVEITEVEFAGLLMKTDNDGDAVMSNVRLHDLYIHDTGSEGMYIGSTQAQPQHTIDDLSIWNCRVVRTGTEAIQLGQLMGHTDVHHNVIGPGAVDWRASFQLYQDNNLQIGYRGGRVDLHHNVILGSAGSMFSMFAAQIAGDDTLGNEGVFVTDNYVAGMRGLGAYLNNVTLPDMPIAVERNVFREAQFERDQLHPTEVAPGHLWRDGGTTTPVSFLDNTWEGTVDLSNELADGNGANAETTGSGNVNGPVDVVVFVDSTMPDDVLDLEMWTATAELGDGSGVPYDLGDVVTHEGLPYQCLLDPCPAGAVPPDEPGTWQALAAFPDDLRVLPGSAYEDLGLSATASGP